MATTSLTVSQAAVQLGIAARTVRKLCADHDIGTLANGRLRLLSAADIKRLGRLKRDGRGNPNFGPNFRPAKKV